MRVSGKTVEAHIRERIRLYNQLMKTLVGLANAVVLGLPLEKVEKRLEQQFKSVAAFKVSSA